MGVTSGITKRPGTDRDRDKTRTLPAVAVHFIKTCKWKKEKRGKREEKKDAGNDRRN